MPKRKRAERWEVTKTAIDLMEKDAGKAIENVPPNKQLIIVKELARGDFSKKGFKIDPSNLKQKFRELILENKFNEYVKNIKNQQNIKKTPKYQLSINPKRRTNYQIQYSILEVSEDGLKKTHIMDKCNLSALELYKYLDNLLRLGLLEYVEEKRIYKTTDLGRAFNYAFQQLRKLLTGESLDKLVRLNKKSKGLAISTLHEIKRKTIYENSALIVEKTFYPSTKNELRKASINNNTIDTYIEFLTGLNLLKKIDTDKFKTTPLGSQYYETYLYFILFNYLG